MSLITEVHSITACVTANSLMAHRALELAHEKCVLYTPHSAPLSMGGKKGGVKVKFADKRMRSDERGLKRAAKAKGRKGTKRFKKGRRTSTGKRR